MPGPIYLDNAATTPLDPAVREVMLRWMDHVGNASSIHPAGREAAGAVAEAATQVADAIGAEPASLVWTSGATESNNLAILGAMRHVRRMGRGGHVITARTEHKAVLSACGQLEQEGVEVTYLPPEADGSVSVEAVAEALRDDTALVSLAHVNNETGAINDLAAIGALLADRATLFHVDAAQSGGRLSIDVAAWHIDLLSLSAHKIHGPPGIGALYLRRRPRLRLQPLLFGGDQQGGVRPGTLPVHQIAGMGQAYHQAALAGETENQRQRAMLMEARRVLQGLEGVLLNGPGPERGAPHILNLSFGGVHGDALAADLPGLAVSTGSACSAELGGPSHVLRALGRPDALAHSSLRLSVGRMSTEQQVKDAVQAISAAVRRLRAISPVWSDWQGDLTRLYGNIAHG